MNYQEEATTSLKSLIETATAIGLFIEGKQKELDALLARITTYQDEVKAAESEWADAKTIIEEDSRKIRGQINALGREKLQLETEVNALIAKRGEHQLENMRLTKQNQEFKTYEEKAMFALEAKEKSLIEREQVIEQKESLKPIKRSILPPRE